MWKRFSVVLILFAFLVAACGGDEYEPVAPAATSGMSQVSVTVEASEGAQPSVSENDCLPHEIYDAASDSCYVDVSCETEEECDAIIASLYEGYDVELEYWEMSPEDCLPGESYDPEESVCYIECETEEECQALAEEIYGGLDVYFDDSFRGDHAPPRGGCESLDEDEEPPIACYALDQNLDTTLIGGTESDADPAHNDPQRHEEMWAFARRILPKSILKEETREYHVFTDGPDGTMAYVSPLLDDPYHWLYAIDAEDAPDPVRAEKEFVHTLVHEFGHILTLRSAQVPPDPSAQDADEEALSEAASSCPTFYTGEGCSKAGSYINLFFRRFWADIYDEFLAINEAQTEDAYEEAAYKFYEKYRDRFVTEYAATNPGEDIAESFTYFVLKDKPTGDTIAEQKVRFFYAFPHLVKVREQIRSQLARLDKK